jgi:hypothetical protein
MNEIEAPILLDLFTSELSSILERGNWSGDDGGTSAGKLSTHKSDSRNILVPVLTGETELSRKLGTDGFAKKKSYRTAGLLIERDFEGSSDRILAAVMVTSEEDWGSDNTRVCSDVPVKP